MKYTNVKATIINLIYAFIAQIISIVLSALMSLVLPKFLNVQQYAYWQLFLFYTSYVGMTHFGLNDGLYLRIGGMEYDNLDHSLIGSQFKLSILFETMLSVLIGVVACCLFTDVNRKYVIMFTCIYLVIVNAVNFLGFVFQATNNTKLYSLSVIIDKVIFILSLGVILGFRIDDFKTVAVLYLFSWICALAFCFWKGRKLIFVPFFDLKRTLKEMLLNVSVGIKLTIANIASLLILGVGRFLIDGVWGVEKFGKISFAITLTNFFLLFIKQSSVVFFPMLRCVSNNELNNFYRSSTLLIDICSPMFFIAYIPIKYILNMWLPEYSESLRFLILLLPICVYDGKMQMVCNTYFKVLRKEKTLLLNNIIAVVISCFLCFIGAYIFKSIVIVVIGMVISIAVRSVISEVMLAKMMNANFNKGVIYTAILICIFISVSWNFSDITAFVVVLLSSIVYLFLNRYNIMYILGNIKKLRTKV